MDLQHGEIYIYLLIIMKNTLYIIAAAASFVIAACSQAPQEPKTIEVTGGLLQGVSSAAPGVTVFRGIPYAQPPVGELRWKKPQPAAPWEGVRVADTFGAISHQNGSAEGTFYWKEFYQEDNSPQSEDCLYLNVWAPANTVGDKDAKLPVAFWIHGGAYLNGHGTEMTMDGDAWAERGVILVTINYRLGILGYLSHPELSAEDPDGESGNYGLYDQIAALKWVRDNISAFGGDPENITVMGQSAGAGSVKCLVASPLSRGMIARAIIQSGGGIGQFLDTGQTQEQMNAAGKAMMDRAGYTSLEAMRAAPAEDFLKIMSWGVTAPHNSVNVLPESFDEAALSGHIADVDYMIGSTLDDIAPMEKQIDAFCYHRDTSSVKPVYRYLFARKLPGSEDGAFHSSELWYMFGTVGRCWRALGAEDKELSDRMMDFWTGFAKTGNPNGSGDTPWHRFTHANPYVQVLNVE